MHATYLVRRVTRPKLYNPLIQHHGTQVLQINGQQAVYHGVDQEGRPVQIVEPVIDFGDDNLVKVQTQEHFARNLPLTVKEPKEIPKSEFEVRYQTVITDVRPYSVAERDCETTTDILVEGKPLYGQRKGWTLGLLGLGILVWAIRGAKA